MYDTLSLSALQSPFSQCCPLTGGGAVVAGGTRTCIHTPGPALHEGELTDSLIQALLSKAALVSFDGRLTEAAIALAAAARQKGVPVLVEAERVRPHLERLLPLADYVVTSAHFPEVRPVSASAGACLTQLGTQYGISLHGMSAADNPSQLVLDSAHAVATAVACGSEACLHFCYSLR